MKLLSTLFTLLGLTLFAVGCGDKATTTPEPAPVETPAEDPAMPADEPAADPATPAEETPADPKAEEPKPETPADPKTADPKTP